MNSLPGLPGNPHADSLKLHQDFGNTLSPTVQATLALAFEQRTAAMLRFLSWEPTRPGDLADAELQAQIVRRLGLDGDDP